MNRFLFGLILLAFLISGTIFSHAGIIKGLIKDEKGETLPFASVFIPGTTVGTAANALGEYQLSLEPGKYNVTCQFIGFKQGVFPVTIAGNEVVQHNFVLQAQGLQMKEITIKSNAEDPAYAIIRQAIKRRNFHLKQVKDFQTSIYLKGVFRTTEVPNKILGIKVEKEDLGVDSTGKGVIYLCEEMASYYSKRPNKSRTIIHSVRESGNANGLGFSQIPSVITFYENNVTLFAQVTPRGLISPIAENALLYYKYKLEGEFKENGRLIFKIKVIPRRAFEPCFAGEIYIADEDFAIHSLSLLTTSKTGIEYLDSLKIDQLFLPLKNDMWVIKNQVFKPKMSLLGFGLRGHFVTVYNDQKVNEAIPDSVFDSKVISSYDKTANKKDTAYWTSERVIPLEDDEVKDYRVKDSIAAVPRDTVRADSLRRLGNKPRILGMLLINGQTFNGKKNRQSFTVNPFLLATNYNSVEGLNIAPSLTYRRLLDTGRTLTGKLALRYGFGNRHFNAMGRIAYNNMSQSWRGRGWGVALQGGKYVFQYSGANPVEPILNTFSTLLYNKNYLKLYERWDVAASVGRVYGNGLSWRGKLNYQYRMPLSNTTDYSWANSSISPMSDNVPTELKKFYWGKHNAMIAQVGLSYQPGYKYIQYPDYKVGQSSDWPTFTLSYDKGIKGIANSLIDYDKWRFDIEGSARLKLFGVLSYNFATGGFLNDNLVSLPDLMHIRGNEFIFAGPYLKTFQLAPFYKFSNTAKIYGEAHVEYNLYGMLTNKIPLFRQLKWYFILGNNTFYANKNSYYTEAFVSIDNIGYKIYRVLRVDFVHSWESQGENHYGIRLGLRTAGLFDGFTNRNGEW